MQTRLRNIGLILAFSFVAFALMYYFIPQARIQLHEVWFGALVAAVLFQGAQLGFGVYVSHVAHYDRLYALAPVVATVSPVETASPTCLSSASLFA